MSTAKKPKRIPGTRILEAIAEGLDEIRAHFGWGNFVVSNTAVTHAKPEKKDETDPDEDDFVEEDDYDDGEEEYFEREEIEVALDAFLSSLLASGVIRKAKSGKSPSFGRVFAKFFGDEGEVVDLAWEFEEDIEGYMGWIKPDAMRSAEQRFLKISDLVSKMIKEKEPHGD
jgi:hypothetical protein